MNKAASLLAMRKYSILEITEMVGYNDYETFRKHFKVNLVYPPQNM